MIGILLGIPDVRVLDIVEDDSGLWVEIEIIREDASCSACGQPAVADGRRVVDMKSRQPMFGRFLTLSWKTRGWKCVNAACSVDFFFEKADWCFGQRGVTTPIIDQSGFPAWRRDRIR
jgi:hypothetical protein